MAFATSASIIHAGPIDDIKLKIDEISNGVVKAEADTCRLFDDHDKIFSLAYNEVKSVAGPLADQIKVFVNAFCDQADVKRVVN
jgi:hypothetical protein